MPYSVRNRAVNQGLLLAQHLLLPDKIASFPGFCKWQMRPEWLHTRSWQGFVNPVCKVVLDWITTYIEMALKFLNTAFHLEINLAKMLTGLEGASVGPDDHGSTHICEPSLLTVRWETKTRIHRGLRAG